MRLKHPHLDLPTTVKSDLLITSVKIEQAGGHERVHVWNRGGKAGVLTVSEGDGLAVAELLLPGGELES